MAFADQLKNLMVEKNMKAVDLARATGLSEASISDYINGKKEPRGRQSIMISKALNVSLDTLWETEPRPEPWSKLDGNKFMRLYLQRKEMLNSFCELSKHDQDVIEKMIFFLAEKEKTGD